MNKRYGSIKVTDLLPIWVCSSILGIIGLSLIVVGACGNLRDIVLGILLIGVSIWLSLIYALQYKERFSLDGDVLTVWRHDSRCENKRLPKDLIVVVSVVEKIEGLLEKNSSINVYVNDPGFDFKTWYFANIKEMANATGITPPYSYSYRKNGYEYVITLIKT